jgi:hypothetical protein
MLADPLWGPSASIKCVGRSSPGKKCRTGKLPAIAHLLLRLGMTYKLYLDTFIHMHDLHWNNFASFTSLTKEYMQSGQANSFFHVCREQTFSNELLHCKVWKAKI